MAKIDRLAHAQMLLDHDLKFTGVVLAGIDEVGRGPLAGNVVTACVVMPPEPVLMWIDDSKKLSESRREKVYGEIMENALYVGIGQATPEEIDEINILEATKKAMREAAAQVPADVFLIDAVTGLGLNGREVPIIKGDATSYA
ncbi:MAG: ribonuclease HII, partial [Clostridiales bacterium]|nr:ribonuclease HII [Clostridiales bacterium]